MSLPEESNSVRREKVALLARIVVVILPLHAAVAAVLAA